MILLYILFLTSILPCISLCQTVIAATYRRDDLQYGISMDTRLMLEEFDSNSIGYCTLICANQTLCRSLNFHTKNKMCMLNIMALNELPEGKVIDQDTIYMDKKDIKRTDQCSTQKCAETEACLTDIHAAVCSDLHHIECPSVFPNPEFTTVSTPCKTTPGSKCNLKCNANYWSSATGVSGFMICLPSGNWSVLDPKCKEEEECPSVFPNPEFTTVSTPCKTTPGSKCNLKCNANYWSSATGVSGFMICLPSGNWSVLDPKCKEEEECPSVFPNPEFTTVSTPCKTTPGSKCNLKCNANYWSSATGVSGFMICLPSGNWSVLDPKCKEEEECPSVFPNPEFTTVSTPCKTTPGSKCNLKCNANYWSSATGVSGFMICLPSGNWSVLDPKCKGNIECQKLKSLGHKTSGVYNITVKGKEMEAYCDMETEGGGWTVVMKRFDGSVNFYQNWNRYKYGFGSARGEYWLGNEYFHILTWRSNYGAYFKLQSWGRKWYWAWYTWFYLHSENDGYKIRFGGYRGNAGQTLDLGYSSGGSIQAERFSTHDRDQDKNAGNKAKSYGGGWWYKRWAYCVLTGKYGSNSFVWRNIGKLRASTIMLRPKQ